MEGHGGEKSKEKEGRGGRERQGGGEGYPPPNENPGYGPGLSVCLSLTLVRCTSSTDQKVHLIAPLDQHFWPGKIKRLEVKVKHVKMSKSLLFAVAPLLTVRFTSSYDEKIQIPGRWYVCCDKTLNKLYSMKSIVNKISNKLNIRSVVQYQRDYNYVLCKI